MGSLYNGFSAVKQGSLCNIFNFTIASELPSIGAHGWQASQSVMQMQVCGSISADSSIFNISVYLCVMAECFLFGGLRQLTLWVGQPQAYNMNWNHSRDKLLMLPAPPQFHLAVPVLRKNNNTGSHIRIGTCIHGFNYSRIGEGVTFFYAYSGSLKKHFVWRGKGELYKHRVPS